MAGRTKADELFDEAPEAAADALFDAAPAGAAPAPDVAARAAAAVQSPNLGDELGPDLTAGGAAGSALRGFGSGASFGFLDELSGLARAPSGAAAVLVGRGARALGYPDYVAHRATGETGDVLGVAGLTPDTPLSEALARTYRAGRGEARQELAQSREAHPYITGASEIAGAIAVPVGAPGKIGRVALTRVGQRALTGAASGAAMGAGYSEEEDVSGVAKDAALSAGIGAVAAPVMGAAGDKISAWLKKSAALNALKALGARAGISDVIGKAGIETEEEAVAYGGRMLEAGRRGGTPLPEPIIKPFGRASGVESRAREAQRTVAGPMIEGALDEAAQGGRVVDVQRAAWEAVNEATKGGTLTATASREGDRARKLVSDILAQGDIDPSFQAVNKLKSDMYRGINYKVDPALKTELEQGVARGLRKSIEGQVGEAAGPEVAAQLSAANRLYGDLTTAQDMAGEMARRQMGHKSLTAMDLAAAAGFGVGGAAQFGPQGVAAGLLPIAAKYAGPRIPSTMAVAQRYLAPTAPAFADFATRAGQQQVAKPKEERERTAREAFLSGN